MNCYSPNFQGFILMKNALNNQVGMLGGMFLWLVANLKQGGIYFIKQGGGNHKIAWVYFNDIILFVVKSFNKSMGWNSLWRSILISMDAGRPFSIANSLNPTLFYLCGRTLETYPILIGVAVYYIFWAFLSNH